MCPIGRCGINWVTHNNLNWLTNKNIFGGTQCSSCTKESANTYPSISHHLQTVNKTVDQFGFHKFTYHYLKICQQRLPRFAKFKLVMDGYTPVIMRIGNKLPVPVGECDLSDDLSNTDSDVSTKLPSKKKKVTIGSGRSAEKSSPPYSRNSPRLKG